MDNLHVWDQARIATGYADHRGLSLAEAAVFDQIDLSSASLLDIGIGAGRTTRILRDLVRRYVGVDYAEAMISASRESLPNADRAAELLVCDVRDLSPFSDNEFDVVFFSYNGIDYLPFEEREAAFGEMLRVLRPGGSLAFSTHNLLRGIEQFDLNYRIKHPVRSRPREVVSWMLHRFGRNPWFDRRRARTNGHAVIRDKDGVGLFATCYVDPVDQRDHLLPRFERVSVFSSLSGGVLTQDSAIRECPDLWLYYLCEGRREPSVSTAGRF